MPAPLGALIDDGFVQVRRGSRPEGLQGRPTSRPGPQVGSVNPFDLLAPEEDDDSEDPPSIDMLDSEEWALPREATEKKAPSARMPRVRRWKSVNNSCCVRARVPNLNPVVLQNPGELKGMMDEHFKQGATADVGELNYLEEDGSMACNLSHEEEEMECLLDSGASANVASRLSPSRCCSIRHCCRCCSIRHCSPCLPWIRRPCSSRQCPCRPACRLCRRPSGSTCLQTLDCATGPPGHSIDPRST